MKRDRKAYFRKYYLTVRSPRKRLNPLIVTGLGRNDPHYQRTRHAMMRVKALQMISGLEVPVCCNCGCDYFPFLEINHIHGGGNKEYKVLKGENVYALVLRGKRKKEDLNILCRVCNSLHFLEMKDKNASKNFKISWLKA